MFKHDLNAAGTVRLFGVLGFLFILVAYTPDADVMIRFKFGKGDMPYAWADELINKMRQDWVKFLPVVSLEAAEIRFIESVKIANSLAEKGEISEERARGHKTEVDNLCWLINQRIVSIRMEQVAEFGV